MTTDSAVQSEFAQALTRIVSPDKRILVIDIERVRGTVRLPIWSLNDYKNRRIHADNVEEWPRLLCYAARWYNEKKPIFEAEWLDRERMVKRSWDLYDEADLVVTFNGKNFDNKHLRSEWLLAGYKRPAPWKDVDLYPALRPFGFESKTLDAVCKRLGSPGKVRHYDPELVMRALDGDVKARRETRLYNIGDVELTEWLYDRLRGWLNQHPFIGTHGDELACNECDSTELTFYPSKRYRAVVLDYALYRCNHCGALVKGGWSARAATTRGIPA